MDNMLEMYLYEPEELIFSRKLLIFDMIGSILVLRGSSFSIFSISLHNMLEMYLYETNTLLEQLDELLIEAYQPELEEVRLILKEEMERAASRKLVVVCKYNTPQFLPV